MHAFRIMQPAFCPMYTFPYLLFKKFIFSWWQKKRFKVTESFIFSNFCRNNSARSIIYTSLYSRDLKIYFLPNILYNNMILQSYNFISLLFSLYNFTYKIVKIVLFYHGKALEKEIHTVLYTVLKFKIYYLTQMVYSNYLIFCFIGL